MKRYSKQREATLEVLRNTRNHPTAAQVYEEVRQKIPNISLGTVYRNLAQLSASGEILSIPIADGFEHFDGFTQPHVHLHCSVCGRIVDAPVADSEISEITDKYSFSPSKTVCVIYGVCKNCAQKQTQ